MHERPTFGSLFAGIGGIDLGLERAGWTGRWQVEWDPYCQHVLAHHWPDVPRHGDITRVDWSTVEPVDLIAGGFPCQPISVAGKQAAQEDVRWLWPEFARAVSVLRPRFVLVENVRNLLGVNGGRALGEVLGDLDTLGYHTERHVISAADVGAPHLRERLWIVGRAEQSGALAHPHDGRPLDAVRAGRDAARDGRSDVADASRNDPDPDGWGLEGVWQSEHRIEQGAPGDEPHRLRAWRWRDRAEGRESTGRVPYPVEVLAGADDGRPDADPAGPGWWAVEPNVGRVAHGVPARVDRLRALGNAVVPQVVEVIGRRLIEDWRG